MYMFIYMYLRGQFVVRYSTQQFLETHLLHNMYVHILCYSYNINMLRAPLPRVP